MSSFEVRTRGAEMMLLVILVAASLAMAPGTPAHAGSSAPLAIANSELERVGCPAEVSLARAVRDFNRRAALDSTGRRQPPLRVEEVVAAIRCWDREEQPVSDSLFKVFLTIANTRRLPKGSYIFFIPGVVAINGYDVDAWWIDLRLGLDQYPTDMADMPVIGRRIRTIYITSRPTAYPFHESKN